MIKGFNETMNSLHVPVGYEWDSIKDELTDKEYATIHGAWYMLSSIEYSVEYDITPFERMNAMLCEVIDYAHNDIITSGLSLLSNLLIEVGDRHATDV